MELLVKICFGIVFALIFVFITWHIFKLAGNDINKIFNTSKFAMIVEILISVILWIIKSILLDSLFDNDLTTIILFCNMAYSLCLVLVWFVIIRNNKRSYTRSIRFRSNYDCSNSYTKGKVNRLLVINITIVPILNIVNIYYFFDTFIIKH